MKDIWVISDTHFGHTGSLKWTDNDGNLLRGSKFSSTEEMDEYMIDRWNSVVKPGDKVYHLGDVFIGSNQTEFLKIWTKLHGQKRVLVGNHDNINLLTSCCSDVRYWRVWAEDKMIFTHVPLHESNLQIYLKEGDYEEGDTGKSKKMMFNVHGHIHHNSSPEGPYFNASVEQLDYTPIHYDELLAIKKKMGY